MVYGETNANSALYDDGHNQELKTYKKSRMNIWHLFINFLQYLLYIRTLLCFSNGWTTLEDVRQNWHKIEGEIAVISLLKQSSELTKIQCYGCQDAYHAHFSKIESENISAHAWVCSSSPWQEIRFSDYVHSYKLKKSNGQILFGLSRNTPWNPQSIQKF